MLATINSSSAAGDHDAAGGLAPRAFEGGEVHAAGEVADVDSGVALEGAGADGLA